MEMVESVMRLTDANSAREPVLVIRKADVEFLGLAPTPRPDWAADTEGCFYKHPSSRGYLFFVPK